MTTAAERAGRRTGYKTAARHCFTKETRRVEIGVETKSAQPAKAPPRGAMPTPPPGAIPKDVGSSMYNQASQPKGKYVPIPENYADPEKSGLTYTVTGGPQTHEIDLK
jgi:hypothetical protein